VSMRDPRKRQHRPTSSPSIPEPAAVSPEPVVGRAPRRGLLILFGVLSAIALLAITEGACRYYLKRFDPEPEFYHGLMTHQLPPLDYGLRPNNTAKETAFGRDIVMKVNSYGFRHSTDPVLPKPNGHIRIFVLGASAAFGLYVQDDETFGHQLENYLKRAVGDRVEVINAAVPGYLSQQELQMLVFRVLPFEPDIVILYDRFNDLGLLTATRETLSPFYGHEDNLARQMRMRRETADRSIYRLLYMDFVTYSGISRVVRRLRDGSGPSAEDRDDVYRESYADAAAYYGRKVQTMAGVVRGHKGEFIVAVQPHLFHGDYQRTPREMALIQDEQKKRPKRRQSYQRSSPAFVAAAQAAARSTGARFVDLTEVFRGAKSDCLLDVVHPSPYGHLIIANRLFEEIRDMIDKRFPAPPDQIARRDQAYAAARDEMADLVRWHAGSKSLNVFNPTASDRVDYLKHIRYHLHRALPGGVAADTGINYIVGSLEVNPENGFAHYDLSQILLSKGLIVYAIDHLKEAIRLMPRTAETAADIVIAHNNLGYSLYKIGKYDEAIRYLQDALNLNPKRAEKICG